MQIKRTARIAILLLHTMLTTLNAPAQTWQWGVRGGSSEDPWSGVNSSNQEDVYDMATDQAGNVYTLSMVTGSAASVGNSYVKTYGSSGYGTANALITSHTCDGRLRWVKAIATQGTTSAIALRTDTLGHVYVMTDMFNAGTDSIYVSGDTVLKPSWRRLLIVQYDTAGTFKWLRMPDPDTLTTFSKSQAYDMEIDAAGNLNALVWLTKGSLMGTAFATGTYALYVLKYTPQGTLIAATRPVGLNFTVVTGAGSTDGYPYVGFESIRMARMPNNNWLLAGTQLLGPSVRGLSINGKTINNELFIACFNSGWTYQWQYTSAPTLNGIFGRPVVDNTNSIYLTGYSFNHVNLFGIALPSGLPLGQLPFVAKLSSSGAGQWITLPSSIHTADRACSASLRGQGLAMATGGDLLMTSGCGGLRWGSFSIPGKCNTGYAALAARFNPTTGTCLGLDTIPKLLGGNHGTAIAAGPRGSVYIGGTTVGVQVAGKDTMIYRGGTSDFFIARYGFACSCVSQPVASFTVSGTGRNLRVTYGGSTVGIDSVVWLWGDGQRQTMKSGFTTQQSHSYTANGSYDICAIVYSSCGTASYCKTVMAANANTVAGAGLPAQIRIYPNPADRFLTIEGAAGATVHVTNALGQALSEQRIGSDRATLDIGSLPPGLYLLQLRDKDGATGAERFLKQ